MRIYEQVKASEIRYDELIFPEYFSNIYIDEYDRVYCYHSIIDKNRFLFGSTPYYLNGIKISKAKELIKGYFRIESGRIIDDEEFGSGYYNEKSKGKLLSATIQLPQVQDTNYYVYLDKDNKDLEEIFTRKVFGLLYNELEKLLSIYNKVFKICPENNYYSYPKITRSLKSDNFCDLSGIWIPPKFPYISFAESGYYYSHVSLFAFYQHIKFLTLNNINSVISRTLIENGLNPNILKYIFAISDSHKAINREKFLKFFEME